MKNKFLISIVWLFLLAPWLYAAGKKAIGIDFFKEVKMISNVQVYQDNIYFIVKQADGSLEIPSRADSLIARAPQSFRLADIIGAHRTARSEGRHDFIDSCTMMSHYGHRLGTIIGPMENIKITTPTDYFVLRAMVKVHEDQQIFGL